MLQAYVLSFSRYSSPILSLVCFLTFSLYSSCSLKVNDEDQRRKIWRTPSLWLSWVIATSYLAQSLYHLAPGIRYSKDEHVHTLSEVLLWTTLALSLASSESPSGPSYITTWILTLVLEAIICVLSCTTLLLPWLSIVLQLFSVFLIAVISLLGVILHRRQSKVKHDDDDDARKPLLPDASSAEEAQRFETGSYSAMDHSSSDDTVFESDSDDDESDEEVRELQQDRLKRTGGWVGYLAGFRIFWPYIWPTGNLRLTIYAILLVANTLITRGLNVLAPRQIGIVIDRLTAERRIPWSDIFLWALFYLLASDSTGLGALNEILERRISVWSMQQLTVASFDHVMQLSMDFHDEKDSGEIIKALEQANSLNSVLKMLILEVVPGLLDILIALWYVAYLLDVYAILIVVAVMIAFTFVTSYITTFVTASRRDLAARERGQSRLLYETVSHWPVVAYFNRRGYEKARLAGLLKGVAQADLRNNDSYVYLYGAQEFSERVGELGIVLLAAHRVATGRAPIGTFVAVQNYWMTITMPLYIMGNSYRQLTSDLVDAERLLQLFTWKPTVQDAQDAKPIEASTGTVEFDDVSFGYKGSGGVLALNHLSFLAQPGQKVALVGETGSGKSTILKLLMRMYDVNSGRILIDGQDARHVTQESLREVFGVVPQDTVLFNTSILENVRYARLDASDEEVYDACRKAAMHDKILTFSHGYHTKVGERGIKLSGGERQRLSIARVILKDPRIVLLDEATSAIDTMTEAKIQNALGNLTSHRTTIAIAHRLSTVMDADLVLVIHQGSIVERGTHLELLQHGQQYRELWAKQASLPSEGT